MNWVSSFHTCQMKMFFFNHLSRRTIRIVFPNSIVGDKIRLKLNARDMTQIEGINIAYYDNKLIKKTMRPITFNGRNKFDFTGSIVSDEISFPMIKTDIAISFYLPNGCLFGNNVGQYGRRSPRGNFAYEDYEADDNYSIFLKFAGHKINSPIPLFQSLDVYGEGSAISALGDSLTAGSNWFTPLQRDIFESGKDIAIGNMGISCNRLLEDTPPSFNKHFGEKGIKRFDDVLDVAGIKYCIFALGANDMGFPNTGWDKKGQLPTVDDFVRAYKKLDDRCRENNIKSIYMPVFPREDKDWDDEKEELRINVNREVAKIMDAFDIVKIEDALKIDGKLNPKLFKDDMLHINEKGGKALYEKALKRDIEGCKDISW